MAKYRQLQEFCFNICEKKVKPTYAPVSTSCSSTKEKVYDKCQFIYILFHLTEFMNSFLFLPFSFSKVIFLSFVTRVERNSFFFGKWKWIIYADHACGRNFSLAFFGFYFAFLYCLNGRNGTEKWMTNSCFNEKFNNSWKNNFQMNRDSSGFVIFECLWCAHKS